MKSVEFAKWQLVVFLEAPQRGEWADGIFFNLETFQSRLEHAQSAFQCKAYSASVDLAFNNIYKELIHTVNRVKLCPEYVESIRHKKTKFGK